MLFVLFQRMEAKLLFLRHGCLIIPNKTLSEGPDSGFFLLAWIEKSFVQFVQWSESVNLGKWAKIDLNDNAAGCYGDDKGGGEEQRARSRGERAGQRRE